jgi:protein-arginine kinase activator protein McsA
MKTFTLAQRENCGKTPPSAEMLKLIEEADKKPDECVREFKFDRCKFEHIKAKRAYKEAIASGAKRPRIQNPCLYCKLISDKLLEEAQKAKGENAIEYEEEEAEKVPTKVVTQKVTKEIDRESNSLVSLRQEKTDKKEEKKVLKTDKPETIKCAYCGKEFSPESPKNKYCSIKCRDKRNNEKRVERYRKSTQSKAEEKTCENCGKTFSTVIKYQRFCCKECNANWHNKTRSKAVKNYKEAKAVPEVKSEVIENSQPKEAPVNSFALKEVKAKVKEPDESIYYVSPKHALTCLSDSLQGFNDVVDLIQDQTDGVISKLAVYLSDDIYETNKRIKSYLDRLEGTSS